MTTNATSRSFIITAAATAVDSSLVVHRDDTSQSSSYQGSIGLKGWLSSSFQGDPGFNFFFFLVVVGRGIIAATAAAVVISVGRMASSTILTGSTVNGRSIIQFVTSAVNVLVGGNKIMIVQGIGRRK